MSFTYIRAADGAAASEAEALDANRCLRPGFKFGPIGDRQHVGFDLAFMDAAHRAATPSPTTITNDAIIAFRDSPEGRVEIAHARYCFELGNHPSRSARTWTADREEAALRAALIGRMASRDRAARLAAETPALAAAAEAARAAHAHALANRWK